MQNCRMGRTLIAAVGFLGACKAPDGTAPIRVDKILTIAGPTEDGGFVGFSMVTPRLKDGTRIVYSVEGKTWAPLVIDSLGVVIDTFAAFGEGPGGLLSPSWIIAGPADSIFVIDLGRIGIYGPERAFVRTVPVAARRSWGVARLPGHGLVTSSASFGDTVPIVGYDLADGTRRFEISVPKTVGQSPSVRAVQVAPDGTIWAVRGMQKFELTQYDAQGRLLRTLAPEVSWFPPYENYATPSRTTPPSPFIVGFWIDSLDRAWIVGQGVDPDWAEAEGEEKSVEGGGSYFLPKRPEDVRDGILQVIDLKTGAPLASHREDAVLGFVVEPWILSRPRVTDDGWVQLDLYQVTGEP